MEGDSAKSLFKALLEARKSMDKIVKDKKNPFHKSNYADLENVINAIMPSLLENGLVLTQLTSGRHNIETIITHAATGQSISTGVLTVPVKDPQDPQKVKSGITYMRRTQILALLSLGEADDDGNSASGRDGKQTQSSRRQPPPKKQEEPPRKEPPSLEEVAETKLKYKERFEACRDKDELHAAWVDVYNKLKTGIINPHHELVLVDLKDKRKAELEVK